MVDLLFRPRTKLGKYAWIESRGRLCVALVRKAIILCGKEMMRWVMWSAVEGAGVSHPIPTKTGTGEFGTHRRQMATIGTTGTTRPLPLANDA
ncbi:hypothetical protein BT96DRAFT_928216 [Gymnopus androsaceus JB14]|uniref:Uncharacterized protein n=1 Tax=Gymnopus androsaceus JB14 TaxID=1447944 RepID=A0A6A4GL17_9AGAR|nr:hypothetical protein BT96DRAFT_928216 [Gymnopus androsaceus JB14]